MAQSKALLLAISIAITLVAIKTVTITATNGITLPLDGSSYDKDFSYNFTKYLHRIYRYDSFVIFSHNNFTRFRANFVNVRPLEQALMEDFDVPIITWGLERSAKLSNHIGLNNLVFVQFSNFSDPILEVVDETLESLHFISILFFYYDGKRNTQPSSAEIESFFEWCWSKNMVNVALYFKSIKRRYREDNSSFFEVKSQIYNYKPFPKLTVQNQTEAAENGEVEFIVNHLKDVQGYVFKTPMVESLPYTFLFNNSKDCQHTANCKAELTGITGRLYSEFIYRINGKVLVEHVKVESREDVAKNLIYAAAEKKIHIGTVPITKTKSYSDGIEASYPILQTYGCIAVPLPRYNHEAHYFWCTFQLKAWFMILVTYLALVLFQIGRNYELGTVTANPLKVWTDAIFIALGVLLGQETDQRPQSKHQKLKQFFQSIILMMIYILTSLYVASMTSMLTTGMIHRPIETVEDFLASGLQILINNIDYEYYFKSKRLPAALKSRLRFEPNSSVQKHRHHLNSSYAYTFKSENWKIAAYQQRRLEQPLFRFDSRELCTAEHFLQLPLQYDSAFLLDLNLFFLRAHESGLSLKWQEMAYWEAKEMNLIDYKQQTELQWRPWTQKDFDAAPIFYARLQCLAIVAFLLEICWYRRQVLLSTLKRTYDRVFG